MINILMAAAARHSWSLRRRLVFDYRLDTPTGPILLEIERGIGWDYLHWRRLDWMVRAFRIARRLRPNGAIIDIGANIGQSLLAAREAAPDAPYFGFEPLPEEYGYIARMIARNGWADAIILPLALSDRAGRARLGIGHDRTTSSLEAGATVRHRMDGVIEVLTATGDEAFARAGIGEIAIIKIDVEGHEPEVFAGLVNTLSTRLPPILFEVLPPADIRERARAEAMGTLLINHGYALARCRLDGQLEWSDTVVRDADASDPDDIRDINWMAVPIDTRAEYA